MFSFYRAMRGPLPWVLTGVVVSCSPLTSESPTTASPTTEASMTSSTVSLETTTAPPTTTQLSTTSPASASPSRVLVFHKTAGFRHDSIEAGTQAVEELGEEEGFEVTATEDGSLFTSVDLEAFDVIVFLNTTGDVLDDDQQASMEEFIQAGKGFVGIHSAADTEYEWEWYGGLMGAYFDRHPDPQSASVAITGSHPVIAGLPEQFERFDEWYDFRSLPAAEVTILATLDETTYEGGDMGQPHPIVWAQDYDGGRSVYIGFGHTPESFAEPLVRTLLANAIAWSVDA